VQYSAPEVVLHSNRVVARQDLRGLNRDVVQEEWTDNGIGHTLGELLQVTRSWERTHDGRQNEFKFQLRMMVQIKKYLVFQS